MAPPGIGDSVEGVHAVAAALEAGRVQRLVVEHGRVEALSGIVDDAERRGVAVDIVDDVRAASVTDAPQGVIAVCRPISPQPLDTVVKAADPPALVILDHVEDPRNVGAIARSAVAAGITGLVVAGRRAAPLGATAFKAAAGALERLAIAEVSSIANAVTDLKKLGVWVVALDAGGDRSLFGLDLLGEPVALLLGAEGRGVSRLARERADVVASIPLVGPIESLNASVAAALAMYEVARVRGCV
jgi:23S rRNA (guanosine2251-2'-O)-methyltransferase